MPKTLPQQGQGVTNNLTPNLWAKPYFKKTLKPLQDGAVGMLFQRAGTSGALLDDTV